MVALPELRGWRPCGEDRGSVGPGVRRPSSPRSTACRPLTHTGDPGVTAKQLAVLGRLDVVLEVVANEVVEVGRDGYIAVTGTSISSSSTAEFMIVLSTA